MGKFFKKVLLSFAAIFLSWQSYELLRLIDQMEIHSLGMAFFFGWIINLFITGIFAFSGFAFPTQRLLPDSYYTIRRPEKLKQLYKALGVNLFRQFLLATFWKGKKQRKKYFDGKKTGIQNLVLQSKKSEFGHLIPFFIICFVGIYLVKIGMYKLASLALLINVIGNLYPIILQRYHRMRIQYISARQREKPLMNSALPNASART